MASMQQEISAANATPMCASGGCTFFGSAATKNFCSQCYKKHVMMKTAAVAPVAEKKVDTAPAPAEKEKHEGSSGVIAAVAENKIDAAPATENKESGSPSETTEKNEAAAAATAAPVMCANGGCSFFGSAATKNMCSGCYRDFILKNALAAPAAAEKKIEVVAPEQPAPPEISAATTSAPPPAKAAPSRCAGCKKKVGLLGFVCRCGGTFCSVHRYRDQHACDFDFKTADREQIAKKNPLVVAPKINKI